MGRHPHPGLWMPVGKETGIEELGRNWGRTGSRAAPACLAVVSLGGEGQGRLLSSLTLFSPVPTCLGESSTFPGRSVSARVSRSFPQDLFPMKPVKIAQHQCGAWAPGACLRPGLSRRGLGVAPGALMDLGALRAEPGGQWQVLMGEAGCHSRVGPGEHTRPQASPGVPEGVNT